MAMVRKVVRGKKGNCLYSIWMSTYNTFTVHVLACTNRDNITHRGHLVLLLYIRPSSIPTYTYTHIWIYPSGILSF